MTPKPTGRPLLTVDECIEATLAAATSFFHCAEAYEKNAPWNEVFGMQQRRDDFLTAVVDDDEDAGYGIERHFVRTTFQPSGGLTSEYADRLIRILGDR